LSALRDGSRPRRFLCTACPVETRGLALVPPGTGDPAAVLSGASSPKARVGAGTRAGANSHQTGHGGFEFAGFWERKLLRVLCSSPGSRHYPLPVPDRTDRAVVYADPRQEVRGILEDLVEAAARYPLHTLGVVVLDAPLYTPLLARELENLFGFPSRASRRLTTCCRNQDLRISLSMRPPFSP